MAEPVVSDAEIQTLREWSFASDFERYKEYYESMLGALLRGARNSGLAGFPEEMDLKDFAAAFLQKDYIFEKLVTDKLYIGSDVKSVYAKMFAGYLVHKLWDEVT